MTAHVCLLGHAPSIHLQRWATAMVERGFRVSVVSAEPHEIAGVPVHLLPRAGALGWFGRVPAARRLLAELAPDIVHGHYVTSYGMLAAAGGRRPLVLTAWGSDILVSPRESRLVHALTGAVLRRAALVTADSRDVLEAIARYRPTARLEEIFWGADTERFVPLPPEAKPAGFHVASLRAWEPNYRIGAIVEALARLRASGPATLHLFGAGSGALSLRDQVARLGLDDSVVWHGQVDAAQLPARLAACQVSVSVPASDATSVSLLESMACGLPVVVSDLAANRQWVSGAGGMVVDGADPTAIAAALQALRDDPARRAAMGTHNRRVIEARASSRVQMDRMAQLYRELLERRPS
ncbi:MAG: glycosyltransferase [Piscinibacter sp.]|uniref:glycosyltransferase n=1 Tax=Piscinibacter sp. TaxID=1903157 RepID=UPI00258D7F0C|nr:glycosyltransferase [Piscinibacter sp.]MCW5666926.1 glycosyltransferase [Piscinibacter sp.]